MGLSLRAALRILGNQRKAAWKWWLEQSLNSLVLEAFNSPALGKERGEGADLAKLHSVISPIISRSIAASDIQLRGCLSIWGSGILRGGQCHLLLCFFSAGISALHMEICWNEWMGGIAATLHMKHQSHNNENTHEVSCTYLLSIVGKVGFFCFLLSLTAHRWHIYKVKQINALVAGFTCVHS